MSFLNYFRQYDDQLSPFPFQSAFHACEADLRVLEVPTGMGKTLTVLADWLSRRPTKRLIYCLPGRALTRQVADLASKIVPNDVQLFELMGGSEDLHTAIPPDQSAIIIGTQDVLISRALNRGYALSPFRWPMDFALLNNDVSWILDEVQLQGEAVATSAQLAAFREQMGTYGRTMCTWMTATFHRSWLNTVDFDQNPAIVQLTDEDRKIEVIRQRLKAKKALQEAEGCESPAACAAFVAKQHKPAFLTLVIANTIARAQEIWLELKRLNIAAPQLLHSRFRPYDQKKKIDQILSATSGIIVSTQVIEAGVDLNADLMVTDVAPWSSLVQRFGRVNRNGRKPNAQIFWVRNPQRTKKLKMDGSQWQPYDGHQVQKALAKLEELDSAAPEGLANLVEPPLPYRYVIRKSDLVDLFDTTPDLAGNHIDVSRFVRSSEETNVYVAWRQWEHKQSEQNQGDNPPPRQRLRPDELCPVPFFAGKNELKDWLKKNRAWSWNYAGDGQWERVDPDRLYPGMRLLVRCQAGSYTADAGWSPDSKTLVDECEIDSAETSDKDEQSLDSDELSKTHIKDLAQHSTEVVIELRHLLGRIDVDLDGAHPSLQRAARLHDWGKAHPVFQQTLHRDDLGREAPDPLLAKQSRENSRRRHARVGFRHELASALAALGSEEFLTAYLIAAHHGKVRMSIRSISNEQRENSLRIARGVREGDQLYVADLGEGECMPATMLSLDAMTIGDGWSYQAATLLETLKPFRLAYLELLLRSADERASKRDTP